MVTGHSWTIIKFFLESYRSFQRSTANYDFHQRIDETRHVIRALMQLSLSPKYHHVILTTGASSLRSWETGHMKKRSNPRPVGGDCKGIPLRNGRNLQVWELNYSLIICPDGKVLEKLGIRPRLWPMSVRLRSHNAWVLECGKLNSLRGAAFCWNLKS